MIAACVEKSEQREKCNMLGQGRFATGSHSRPAGRKKPLHVSEALFAAARIHRDSKQLRALHFPYVGLHLSLS